MNVLSRTPLRVRHPLKLRQIQVAHVIPLSPHMQRIVFTGTDLKDFTTAAADDHVKLFFPHPETGELTLPVLGPDSRATPNPDIIARDYTPRRFDAETHELTIDFVLHDTGPATHWASQAKPGQILGMGGPKGSYLVPEDYSAYLLIGDETALPAIARRLAEMPCGTPVTVLVETADPGDDYPMPTAAHASIHRLHRNDVLPGESHALDDALRDLTLTSPDIHVWIAAEIDTVRRLRDYLINEEAIPRANIRAAGYWRRDTANGGSRIED